MIVCSCGQAFLKKIWGPGENGTTVLQCPACSEVRYLLDGEARTAEPATAAAQS